MTKSPQRTQSSMFEQSSEHGRAVETIECILKINAHAKMAFADVSKCVLYGVYDSFTPIGYAHAKLVRKE